MKKWAGVGFLAILVGVVMAAAILNNINAPSSSEDIINALEIDDGDQKIDWSRFETFNIELEESLNISQSGVYHLTGALTNGNIIINTTDGKVKLILDNVTIKNSNGPAIICYAADDLVIELIGENNLSDGKTYKSSYDEDVNAVIYSKADLTFQGEGSLNLTAKYKDGIAGKDDLKFISGAYNITANDDGIRGKDSVYIVGGEFNIEVNGDGIKSTNETSVGKGFVLIEKGSLNISAGDDGIHGINRLVIYDGKINIIKSFEGLESQKIYISGGEINVVASDDGINAGGGSSDSSEEFSPHDMSKPGEEPKDPKADENCVLEIAGGTVYIDAGGDGVDSNGYVIFSGGNVIVDGPTNNGNGALDAGIEIVQTSGTVLALGASGMAEGLGESSTVGNASIYFPSTQSAGTNIEVKNSADEVIISHTSKKTFNHIAVGSTDFKKGETYTIYINNKVYKTFMV